MTARILVFDVNKTLLDVKALRPLFASVVGDEALLGPWFGMMLRNSLVAMRWPRSSVS